MKKKGLISGVLVCFSVLIFFVYSEEQKKVPLDISPVAERSEIVFSFPPSLKEKWVEIYVEAIKNRIAFISYSDDVKIQRKGKAASFSFVRSDFTDVDILFLTQELLKNIELNLYEIGEKDEIKCTDDMLLRPDNPDNIGNGKILNLVAVSPEPFLTVPWSDMSRFYLDTLNINGKAGCVLKIILKEKNSILEEKTASLSGKGRMIYYQLNDGVAGVMPVLKTLSDELIIPLEYKDTGEFLEMQYKYPLPEVVE